MEKNIFAKLPVVLVGLVVLLFVAGCVPAQEQPAAPPAPEEPAAVVEKAPAPAATPPPTPVQAQPSYEITQETLEKLNAVFTKATILELSESSKKMSFGDVYVFAIGVTNTISFSDNFTMQVEFRRSYDKYGN